MCHSISREIAKPQSPIRTRLATADDAVMPGPARSQAKRESARFGRLSTAVRDGVRRGGCGNKSEGF